MPIDCRKMLKRKRLFLAPKVTETTRSKGESGGISGVRRVRRGHCGSQANVQNHADILDLGTRKILKNRNEVKQFIVVCVREPAADGDRVLRVEDVGSWRIVDDDGFPEITANLREILIWRCQRILDLKATGLQD